jgi:hypothetical protein
LDDAANKLRPAHRRLESKQRELFQLTGQLLDADAYGHAKPALDALAVASDLLPEGSWVTRYKFDGRSYHLEGQGISNKDLSDRLVKAGYQVAIAKPTNKGPTAEAIPKSDAQDASKAAVATILFSLDINERPASKAKAGH